MHDLTHPERQCDDTIMIAAATPRQARHSFKKQPLSKIAQQHFPRVDFAKLDFRFVFVKTDGFVGTPFSSPNGSSRFLLLSSLRVPHIACFTGSIRCLLDVGSYRSLYRVAVALG